MPEKPLTIATYAAGASLAAITLVYVFAPTFFIDGESANSSASSRKKGVVGLSNPANDCFINSVLQALAGLGDLRIYLIQEIHRRKLDGPEPYAKHLEDPARKGLPTWKIEGLQRGIVTLGLKEILDALNERPIYKKTISAAGFVAVLEHAFKQRISRQQQDAQEFLQVVAERLCDEYRAGHRARKHARRVQIIEKVYQISVEELEDEGLSQLRLDGGGLSQPTATVTGLAPVSNPPEIDKEAALSVKAQEGQEGSDECCDEDDGFPLEGGSESQIECLTCGFKPKPTSTTFCSLTLSVPQVSSTTLNACFDGMFKTEYIEDFKCEKCRLIHALNSYEQEMARSNSENFKAKAQTAIDMLQVAIETNPEEELTQVELPDRRFAPKRKIAKYSRITKFPKILAIHLSRSIFDVGRSTMKNSAKVSFPERLPLGGLLDQKIYKLLSVVCHKGSHHSGHYESFRRQNVYAPYSTPNTFQMAGIYSKPSTPVPSQISTPQILAQKPEGTDLNTGSPSSSPELLSPMSAASTTSLPLSNGMSSTESPGNSRPLSTSTLATNSTTTANRAGGPTSAPRESETSSIRSLTRSARETLSKVPNSLNRSTSATPTQLQPSKLSPMRVAKEGRQSVSDVVRGKRKKKMSDRWWRISDETVKESKTSNVLGMQREVYLLFYELDGAEDA